MAKIKRIGVLTGGGDCPGLNAVIRAVTKTAIKQYGLEVIGILDGYAGMVENHMRQLHWDDVSNILTIGGTILGTSNKANPFRYATGRSADGKVIFEDLSAKALANARSAGIEAL
ncbi:MAG: 6-phosphofructokinase, partial [Phycisphaerae bacterium]|nr:6-phosphofructokinase [Phycisphaerae bacterium]